MLPAKDIALYAIEVCTSLPLEHFQSLPINGLGTFSELGPCAAPLFNSIKQAVIREIARNARTSYPSYATAAASNAATRLIIDAITDLRDDQRLTHIVEVTTPDGIPAKELTARLGNPTTDIDPWHDLFPVVMRAANDLLDGIELHLSTHVDRPNL